MQKCKMLKITRIDDSVTTGLFGARMNLGLEFTYGKPFDGVSKTPNGPVLVGDIQYQTAFNLC